LIKQDKEGNFKLIKGEIYHKEITMGDSKMVARGRKQKVCSLN
jgi:hypothetical protein